MSYTIVALPENNILEELQSIRDYFYQNDFRYYNKPVSDLAHISLSVINDNLSDWFISELTKIFEWEKFFNLSEVGMKSFISLLYLIYQSKYFGQLAKIFFIKESISSKKLYIA